MSPLKISFTCILLVHLIQVETYEYGGGDNLDEGIGNTQSINQRSEDTQTPNNHCECTASWSSWSRCSVTCGSGTKTRTRHSITCAVIKDVTSCKPKECRIDGGYTEYSSWSSCSKSCGSGIRERIRTCTNPKPRYGGKDCITFGLGGPKQQETCNTGCCPVPLYRYWNSRIRDHFYTTNYGESGAGKNGWKAEGIQCHIFPCRRTGTVPLYRYWGRNDHFYTTNAAEIGTTVSGQRGRHGYVSESITGYCYPNKYGNSIPLYRYFNPASDHFYTTRPGKIGTIQTGVVGRHGYKSEGIACFVLP